MHTIKVLAVGFLLLGICLLLGKLAASQRGMLIGALVFIPLWLVGAGINMYLGVRRADYTPLEELPFFFFIFLLPALPALLLWWMRK